MLSHLAIIMDGNGRWATARHLPRTAGHKKGAETVRAIIKSCGNMGIKHLTLYTFSTENWDRPEDEVNDLMNLLCYYLNKELGSLNKNGVCIKILGDKSRFSKDIQEQLIAAETLTAKKEKLFLNVALNYGSRQELVNAAIKLAEAAISGKIKPNEINQDMFPSYLYTSDMPDPDLLIRTGGEQRLSNFLLWQSAYTEFYFTDVLWPDFDEDELKKAINEFYSRERRYGKTQNKKRA